MYFYIFIGVFVTKLPRQKGLFCFNVAAIIMGSFFMFDFVNNSKVMSSVLICLCRFINSNIFIYNKFSIFTRCYSIITELIISINIAIYRMGIDLGNKSIRKFYDTIYCKFSNKFINKSNSCYLWCYVSFWIRTY